MIPVLRPQEIEQRETPERRSVDGRDGIALRDAQSAGNAGGGMSARKGERLSRHAARHRSRVKAASAPACQVRTRRGMVRLALLPISQLEQAHLRVLREHTPDELFRRHSVLEGGDGREDRAEAGLGHIRQRAVVMNGDVDLIRA